MDDTEAQGPQPPAGAATPAAAAAAAAVADTAPDAPPPPPGASPPDGGADGLPTELGPLGTLAAPVLVPRWVQLVLLPLAILGLYQLARATGSLVLILIGAGVVAVIINPLVKRLQRRMPHGLAILLAWILIWIALAAIIALLSEPVATQVGHFSANFPHWVAKANTYLKNLQHFLNQHGLKVHIAQQGHTALQTIEKKVLKSSGSIVSFSSNLLGRLVTLSVDLVLTFVLSIYFLAYSAKIGALVRRVMPPGDGTPVDDYPLLVQKVVSGYVRGQLTFSLVMGCSAALLLYVLGVTHVFDDGSRFALFFGLFYGLAELIPYVGPIVGPIPPILVALVTQPIAALWVLVAFVGLQQLEGHIVAPQLFRISLRINPILVILALLVGEKVFGIAGALLALPVATIIRQTVIYLRAHLVLERWSTTPPV